MHSHKRSQMPCQKRLDCYVLPNEGEVKSETVSEVIVVEFFSGLIYFSANFILLSPE